MANLLGAHPGSAQQMTFYNDTFKMFSSLLSCRFYFISFQVTLSLGFFKTF